MDAETHWFWWALTGASIAWYSTVTLLVAYRGVADIRRLLRQLESLGDAKPDPQ